MDERKGAMDLELDLVAGRRLLGKFGLGEFLGEVREGVWGVVVGTGCRREERGKGGEWR